jgi:hypothetical protein
MFIVYPTNIDYLIPDVRMRIGDTNATKTRFSDSIIRTALVGGIKTLQRRWRSRYLVFTPSMLVDPLPSDVIHQVDYDTLVAEAALASGTAPTYGTVIPVGSVYALVAGGYACIPSGLDANDVYRNPHAVFVDSGSESVISQEDEHPVILAASVILRTSQISSSADSFQSWSDGEFSYSNLGSQRALDSLYINDARELDAYFKERLAGPMRSTFGSVRV